MVFWLSLALGPAAVVLAICGMRRRLRARAPGLAEGLLPCSRESCGRPSVAVLWVATEERTHPVRACKDHLGLVGDFCRALQEDVWAAEWRAIEK